MKLIKKDTNKMDIIAIQGKTWELYFKMSNKDGSPVDLTGAIIRGQIRKRWSDPDKVADWVCNITNATQGEWTASLSASVTAGITCGDKIRDQESQYVYDIDTVLSFVKVFPV